MPQAYHSDMTTLLPVLANQQKKVFDYVKKHPHCTIEEIRQATMIRKPCMRISEINQLWRQLNGIPHSTNTKIIGTFGRNKYREALKAIVVT